MFKGDNPRMEQKELLLQELEAIKKWENDQEDIWFWEKWAKIPFAILDKLTPAFIHKKVNVIIEELGNYVNKGSKYLIKPNLTLNKFGNSIALEDVKHLKISETDTVADSIIQSRKKFATTQGATTGIGGIFTLAIDIPALLGTSLNVLQEMAICYGFNPEDENERLFIIKCLQFASSDIVGKQTILNEIKDFNSEEQRNNGLSQVQSWREVISVYRDNYGWKKLFQMVPIAGIVFGAYLNRQSINDVAETGKMLYKKRRILEKLNSIEE